LSEDQIGHIVDIQMQRLAQRLAERKIDVREGSPLRVDVKGDELMFEVSVGGPWSQPLLCGKLYP
jgi:hypothetical protein